MSTGYYISLTDQATATVDGATDAILVAQGFERVSFLRWLWMTLFVIKASDYYANYSVKS